MSDHRDKIFQLLNEAELEGYSPSAGAVLEEAIQLADDRQDPEIGLLARYFYIFAIAPIEPHKALVAFAWAIAHEEHCGAFLSRGALMQLYGIVVGILRSYPDYTLEQIERTFEEMERKWAEVGLPARDMAHHRLYGALGTGQRELARECYERWQRIERPQAGWGCAVCDVGTQVLYHLYQENHGRGLALAREFSEGLRCEDGQPLMALSASLVPSLRVGDLDGAATRYRQSEAELHTLTYAGIWAAGRHLAYLAMVGDEDEALEKFRRHFPVAWTSGTPADRFGYLTSAQALFRRLGETREHIDLDLPADVDAPRNSAGAWDVAGLDAFFGSRTRELGSQFDARNGNGEFERFTTVFFEVFAERRAAA